MIAVLSFFLTMKQGNAIQGLLENRERCSNAYLPLAVSRCSIHVPTHSTIRPCASMSLFNSRPNQGLTRRKKKRNKRERDDALSGRN